jgi:hypothetical protein
MRCVSQEDLSVPSAAISCCSFFRGRLQRPHRTLGSAFTVGWIPGRPCTSPGRNSGLVTLPLGRNMVLRMELFVFILWSTNCHF